MTREEFRALCRNILILDGATGSNLQKCGMPSGVHAEDWLPDHRDAIISLQRAYRDAGSQMVYAPTFTASPAYHTGPVGKLNAEMVQLSREAVPDCYVAGDLTTVARYDMPEAEMNACYEAQLDALLEANVDALVIETMMGISEALCALRAARRKCELPVLCSFTVTPAAMLYFGGSVYDGARRLEDEGADAVGVNCSFGPKELIPVIRTLRELVTVPLIAKPNAGLPAVREDGSLYYSLTPQEFGACMAELLQAGASAVGGCCGTEPAHIRALRKTVEQFRKKSNKGHAL